MSQFTLIASFEAKPGREQALKRELNAMVKPSLAEDGCLDYLARPFSLTRLEPTRQETS